MFSALRKPGSAWKLPLALVCLALAWPATGSGDDRDLLRTSTAKPYVFIVLDTSGSMNWTPPCSQAQIDAGDCSTLCTTRDCFARLQSDDQDSKTYVAKEALFEVLQSVNDVEFGFATYNQDDLFVEAKHWIYLAGTGGVSLPGGTVSGKTYPSTTFPAAGAPSVFGKQWGCDTGGGDNEISCDADSPADLDDTWELAREQRLPKGDTNFNQTVTTFIRWAGVVYKVTYSPNGTNTPGAATAQWKVKVDKCTKSDCSTSTNVGQPVITYSLSFTNGRADEFLSWETGSVNRVSTSSNPTVNYFASVASDHGASNTCAGWDSNFDTSGDPGPDNSSTPNVNLRFPTDSSDLRGGAFYVGDVIPIDWKTDHKLDIMRRLAPNLVANPSAQPDFRVATYFKDVPNSGESFLRLKDTNARPLIMSGSTPLGNTMNAFKTWYESGCTGSSCSPKYVGWKTSAASLDPDWGCRRKYLLVITDGDDTCGGNDPCTVASTLRNTDGILTYVVGLGLAGSSGNKLTCMAANGGTGAPIYPQNKQELVDALTVIFGQIKEQASSFASAAVPSVQIEAADKIYISNFTPLNGESFWTGHVDAYLKPLPLTPAGLPDRTRDCGSSLKSACHLWDSGQAILNQAPLASDLASAATLDASALHLGLAGTTQRRVFYGKAAAGTGLPRSLRLFAPPSGAPATDADWQDLFQAYGYPGSAANATNSANQVKDSMKELLVVKSSTIDNGSGTPIPIDYVLGDTFHADPILVDKPSELDRFLTDLYGNGQPCSDNIATNRPANPGYKCWSEKHQFRRKMLAIASDDGQLHFFDAGIYRSANKAFDNGTGAELFSYIPRLALPIVRNQTNGGPHMFGLDSTPRIQEVFIDPAHNGTPLNADRQWRTVAVGGFREGGKPLGGSFLSDFVSGYYALDITQPDTVASGSNLPATNLVPDCLTLGNTAAAIPSGCGPVPFPALLWEFTDSLLGSRLDEDGNGVADLGQTWSVPTVGRIQIKSSSNVTEDRWVAVFGGGMDGDNKTSPKTGTYVYILDVETGTLLYKQKVTGAVPAEPAVLDKDNNGIIDTIYIGTTAGFMYRIDTSKAVQLQSVTLATNKGLPAFATAQTVQRITDSSWLPVAVFDTGGRPIYNGATALFLSALSRFALTFGTGDREDLWNISTQEGRFYLIVDEGFTTAQTEASYTQITPNGVTTNADLVTDVLPPTGKNRGWYMRLRADERLTARPFGLSGLIVFSTYKPDLPLVGPNGVCGRTGTSFAYTVYGKNANPLLLDPDTNAYTRYQTVDVFLAPPTVDFGSTKNPKGSGTQSNVAKLTPEQINIMKNLMAYFPKGTRFGNYFYTVSAEGSDTRYVGIAAIPIGMIQRNWKVVQ